MKKISVLFLMVFLIVGTLGFVVADDDSEELDIPEAKRIGFFENAFDHIGFAFIFNKEKKIERALGLAEKRLAEAEALAEEDPERAERAQKRYDAFVAKAEGILENIADAKVKNENISINNMGKIARIQNKFERHREQAARIHTRALERFEENNASDEKIERFENFYERALSRSDRMEDKILQKRGDIIKRHKVLAEKSDEELENILEDIEKREGLVDARKQRIERAEVRIQKLTDIKNRNIERVKARLDKADLTDEQKVRIQSNLGELDSKLDAFRKISAERIEVVRERLGEAGVSENAGEDDSVALSSISNYKMGTVTREDVKKALINRYKSGTLTRSVLRAVIIKAYKADKLTRDDVRWLIIHSYNLGELTRDDVRWLIIHSYNLGELTRDDVHWLIIKSYKARELTLRDVKELLKAAYRRDELTKADIVWLLQKAYQAGELTEAEVSEAEVTGESNENTSSSMTVGF